MTIEMFEALTRVLMLLDCTLVAQTTKSDWRDRCKFIQQNISTEVIDQKPLLPFQRNCDENILDV